MSVIVGVDLGKTSCRLRVERDGHPVGTAVVPGTRGLADPGGADAARAAILAALAEVLGEGSAVDVLAVGAAGREAAGPGLEHGLAGLATELVLTSDAIISHAGAFSGGAGAVVAIGTGAVAVGLGPLGLTHVDGLGYWLGDDGGGSWIGRVALRRALDARAGRGPETALVAAAGARYGDLARLPGTLAAGDRVAATTAAFALDVVAAAE
ncbi:MAG: BadF/BadG/BcrA/BcrD ATPase family protein, partial [Nocardioides sp.]